MKKYVLAIPVVLLVIAAFLGGYWYSRHSAGSGASGGRKVLYYVDPMNPGHRYDKPGIAPCGMALEPVYADGGGVTPGAGSVPAGAVRVSPDKQQLIGVRTERVEKGSASHMVRLLGRVAADETRIYRITVSVDGWIRSAAPVSAGSLVKKDETLATFYAPEFLAAQQAYIYTLGSQGRPQPGGKETTSSQDLASRQLKQYENGLRNLGMGEQQIREIAETRKFDENIKISSPITGFVLQRNISPGQRFEKGSELFRIGDLSRVWILVDTYENEARWFRPGQGVPVRYQGKTFTARVSHVLPQFDPATRTLKVRLEMDNPGYLLRPDMFVDIEFPVTMPPGITVPADAVIDSGLKKTVYVDRGNGNFEPRTVETGRWFNERVEIVRGLMPGERIVVSGNFLLDSESRMRSASTGMSGTESIDPSCGMAVDEGRSRAAGLTSQYRGKTYFFCSIECKHRFDKSPQKFSGKPPDTGKDMGGGQAGHAHQPKNGGQMTKPESESKMPAPESGGQMPGSESGGHMPAPEGGDHHH
jgi:RND family efflux transporter MFP subunit